jgi:hypothetical protein
MYIKLQLYAHFVHQTECNQGWWITAAPVVDRTIETHPQNSSRSLQPLQFSIKSLIGISICLRLLEKPAH